MITPIVPTTMDRLHVLAKMASPEMDLFVLVTLYFFLQLLSLLLFIFSFSSRCLEAAPICAEKKSSRDVPRFKWMSVTAVDNQISSE